MKHAHSSHKTEQDFEQDFEQEKEGRNVQIQPQIGPFKNKNINISIFKFVYSKKSLFYLQLLLLIFIDYLLLLIYW
jgi:hypothetical protein